MPSGHPPRPARPTRTSRPGRDGMLRLRSRAFIRVWPGQSAAVGTAMTVTVGHGDVDRVALDLGRPAGHVVEQVRGQRNVGSEGDSVGLAVVQRFDVAELFSV